MLQSRFWITTTPGGSPQSNIEGNKRSTIQDASDSRQTQNVAFQGQTNQIFEQDYRNEKEYMQSQSDDRRGPRNENSEREADDFSRTTDQKLQGVSDTRSISNKNAQAPTSGQPKSKEEYDEELAGDWGIPTTS